ncbi:bifunctional ADP-dependent NAD(P)H-hydrate dehydratase/NAD(P)H-hydrate epimerase [Corynebacterium urogenitale]
MSFLYSVEQVRAAENVLLEQQSVTDELMQSAASEVADVARSMLPDPAALDRALRVLLLVGPGGNGGDALYAGRDLLLSSCDPSFQVSAFAFAGHEKTHATARTAFEDAGGTFLDSLDGGGVASPDQCYDLVIDGLFGLGSRGGVGEQIAEFLHWSDAPLLAVDIPSGVAGDTGAVPEPVGAQVEFANHVRADVTVTFGGLRRVHGLTVDCGRVVCRDIRLLDGQCLADALLEQNLQTQRDGGLSVSLYSPTTGDSVLPFEMPGEPGASSDKYSGGVVGICAGGRQYPGAGILATTAAVRATSSMVRWIGEDPLAIVLSNPEVVAHPSVEECGRVQAWVFGPGRGTGADAAHELSVILDCEEPVLIDADGLTLLAKNPELLRKLRDRGSAGVYADDRAASGASAGVKEAARLTILTPHAGEFARLAEALRVSGGEPEAGEEPDAMRFDLAAGRIEAASAMARELNCTVLLKGRFTVITDGVRVDVVDAGSSWAATAGSGDVLAGIIGALLAERGRTAEAALVGQFIHSVAAYESARTPVGFAPTSASKIAEKIPEAIAVLNQGEPCRVGPGTGG